MGICYIVGAAPFCERLSPGEGDLVIAADGGQGALARMGIVPSLVVGDFDSSPPPKGVPYVKHPREKDDTDTALALREGAKRGYKAFALYGCTGGRPDHAFGVVQTMLGGAREGKRIFLVGEGMVGTVLVSDTLTLCPAGTVSVFSLTEHSSGVTLRGLKYPLDDAVLTNDFPLGVSNEGYGGEATVSVREGALYVLWEADGLSGLSL